MKKNKKISYRNLIILIIAIILLIIIGIAITMARYKSVGNTEIEAEIAFFVIEEGYQAGNIMLAGLYPRQDPFEYTFTVANTDGTNVSEVSLDYTVEIKMTTNLPLEIEIYKDGTKLEGTDIITNSIELDESNQCYIRKINIKNGSFRFNQSKTDTYKISAVFPETYKSNSAYESVIDHVSIVVDAKQKI